MNNHQSLPNLQQTPLGGHKSEMANHRPGKPDMLSQPASVKSDMLSYPSMHSTDKLLQHAKQESLYKRAVRAQNSRQAEE